MADAIRIDRCVPSPYVTREQVRALQPGFVVLATYGLLSLPLILLAQWFVRDSAVPAFARFAGKTIVSSVFLLLTRAYGVRCKLTGRILNGPRRRIW